MRAKTKHSAFTADGSHRSGPCTLKGFSIRESAGSTARVTIRDGGASGTIVYDVTLASGESTREWFGGDSVHAGVAILTSLYAKVESGTIVGSLLIAD